jgi:uncharacterized protein
LTFSFSPRQIAAVAAVLPAALLLLAGAHLSALGDGRTLVFALGLGVSLGIVLQRARFCFFCHARDYFDPGPAGADPRGLLSILLALAVGTVGMHLVYAGWLPVPMPQRLPADAHIGPVSWALALAGVSFGLGMVISGSCISAHWYRLGEGSPTAPFALLGSAIGFVVGFNTWNTLYSLTIATAQPLWLPHFVGYTGSVLITLLVLALAAAWWSRHGWPAPQIALPTAPRTGAEWARRLFGPQRWSYAIGALVVGWLSTLVLLRLRPLGVTAALGSAARDSAAAWGWVPERLDGLDQLAGCATRLEAALWDSPNAQLLLGLVGGSLAAALLSGQFQPRWPRWRHVARGLTGGVLLGWGAMTGLGCTVGTLLSGTMAGALSGWVFGAAMLAAVWVGLRLGLAAPR